MIRRYGHWINGSNVDPVGGRYLLSTRPATGDAVCEVADGDADDVDSAVNGAHAAADAWRNRKPIERGRLLADLASAIRHEADMLTALDVDETGKPNDLGAGEVQQAAEYFEFYAGLVNVFAGEVIDTGPGTHTYTTREPFGVIGIITPWNAPLNQAARASGPALAAGNTVVIKPSEMSSASSLELARLASEVGFPHGVMNVVTGDGLSVGQPLAEHPLVRMLAFTGSVRAGRAVAAIAADRVVPVLLELGGKSANIVFDDADVPAAVEGTLAAFTGNTGQYCNNGTRLLVHEHLHDEFVAALVAGSPAVEGQMGQLTTEAQFDKVRAYFDIAEADGARLAAGGSMTEGWKPQVTIYTDVTPAMRIAREEIFGPVLAVLTFTDEDEAVRLANDSDLGLAAGLWTRDISRAHRVAGRLEAGQVYVNTWGAGIEAPFGGYKQSGIGREKGIEALRQYTQLKCVTVAL